jgi:hypothetical protein
MSYEVWQEDSKNDDLLRKTSATPEGENNDGEERKDSKEKPAFSQPPKPSRQSTGMIGEKKKIGFDDSANARQSRRSEALREGNVTMMNIRSQPSYMKNFDFDPKRSFTAPPREGTKNKMTAQAAAPTEEVDFEKQLEEFELANLLWSVTTRSFCTLCGQVGLKGYAEITCKITFSKIEEKMSVQKDLVVTLQPAPAHQRCGGRRRAGREGFNVALRDGV